MNKALRIIGIVAIVIVAFAMQQPAPIPPFEGDGNPQHDGQPSFCINTDTKQHLHNCDCQPHMGDQECKDGSGGGGENSKCKVYCRKDACKCSRDCGKTE